MLRIFTLGFMRIHILHHTNEKPIYGAWIMKELGKHGYTITPGTLYPMLHKMEKEGYLKSYEKVVEGKIRKYYEITQKGKELLEAIKPKIRELVEKVL